MKTMPVLARTLPLLGRSAAPDLAPDRTEPLEDALLRRSLGALHSGRITCRHCHRTPLVGERVHLYGEDVVCELCRPLHRAAPDASPLVRSPEHARAVRPCARSAP